MTETTQETQPKEAPQTFPDSFQAVLAGLVGKIVTVVNPESFEDAPVGNRLVTGFYRCKVLSVNSDYLALATEFKRRRGEVAKEPVRQYIPFDKIKRISLMKSDRLIHI